MYNLRAACHTCNNAKADLSVEEFFEAVGLALDIRDKFTRKPGDPMQVVNDKLYNWASHLDINAQLQAERTARLPIVERVALMPDAHLGMGATVGSVIATNGAVIPAAVGVDIGCVDADTEYLSPRGWVRIADYNDSKVAQYDPDTRRATFVEPQDYIVNEGVETLLHFKTKYGIDMALSPDHRVLAWKIVGRDRRRERVVLTAGELAEIHESRVQGAKYEIETAFLIQRPDYCDLTLAQVRVHVMVSADAWMDNGVAQLRLKKDRKISRARTLLREANIEYSERVVEGDIHQFRFRPPLSAKGFRRFWGAGLEVLAVIADEVVLWDGSVEDSCFYTSVKDEADFISYCFAATGLRSVTRVDVRDEAEEWRVYGHTNTKVGFAGSPKTPVETIPTVDGRSYCFTVPTGFLVMRRNGHVFITGNCGMAAVEFDLTADDLPDDLEAFMPLVERAIPAGVGQGHDGGTNRGHKWLKDNIGKFTTDVKKEKLTGLITDQLGSLGSGNHFFEICLDERDHVWIVLHSGSRGIGNKLAQRHIRDAQKLAEAKRLKLEDPDLAYLMDTDAEFSLYVGDMLACQDWAMANRKLMLDRALAAFAKFMGRSTPIIQTINCHHNFTQKEIHGGREVWITRKGAIKADVGDKGIIPGSMGTRSYIISGLGNPDSFCSCSHGAGRVLSRGEAKRRFTEADLEEAMEGKVWNADKASHLVDEIPASYKDIDQVMADQADLVSTDHVLRQILNYKGAS